MSTPIEDLKERLQGRAADLELLARVEQEQYELNQRLDALEGLLITIVRTGWPWDEEGVPNAIHESCRDGFAAAMVAARELLGLGLLSSIGRTEPRT